VVRIIDLRHNTVVKLATAPVATDDIRTRDAVARSILENGPSTAAALSEKLGFTPAGIRRHLDALVADGVLEAREPHAALVRGRGRPSKVFVMTDNGREKFEHSYDDLAVAALKFMSAQVGEQSIKAFADSRADDIIKKASLSIAKRSHKSEALATFLSDQGYAASVAVKTHGEEICQHHCPIAHVAAEFPQLCEAETRAFSELLGTHVQRLATIAHGDGVCTTFIPKTAGSSSTKKGRS
jgi:predicted ArsR family transcriptional regulator